MLTPTPTHMTVADYCAAMDRREITVNTTYQRSHRVWPSAARSFLIESVILGFPIPKVYLHSRTDVRTRRTSREIIDGQQRSRAIYDFYHDRFRLSNRLETHELAGNLYSEMSEEHRGRFLTYLISIDQFTAAEESEVRQIFRRMNSYTVPLNPEELRHAVFQGAFKWFIASEAETHQEIIRHNGVLTDRSIFRMQDLKLVTEVVHAFDQGVRTTSKVSLEAIYRRYDVDFAHERTYGRMLDFAFRTVSDLDVVAESNLSKPYIFYSLLVALGHQVQVVPGLEGRPRRNRNFNRDRARNNLLKLSDALEIDDEEVEDSPYASFIEACSERTNVRSQRLTRVGWFLRAMREELPEVVG